LGQRKNGIITQRQEEFEDTKGVIKNGQSRETGNKTKENKTKTQHNI
jgi:hypothetical protein